MSSRDLVSRVDVRAWLHGYLKAAISLSFACACSACMAPASTYDDAALDQALAQAGGPAPSSCPSWRRSCHRPVCGNRVVENGEACDDGNLTSGDGCSASCQREDNAKTPGDDRAGYATCTSSSSGTALTCGDGLGCCPDPTNVPAGPICAATRTDCGFVMAFIVFCDGPEDCAAGQVCLNGKYDNSCVTGQPGPAGGYAQLCHSDRDCGTAKCASDGWCQ